jgi:hypothetical protein
VRHLHWALGAQLWSAALRPEYRPRGEPRDTLRSRKIQGERSPPALAAPATLQQWCERRPREQLSRPAAQRSAQPPV